MTTSHRHDFGYSRTVSYVNRNHLSVITQRWGSVNRKVLPFCIANVILAVTLIWLLDHGIDLRISEFGHELMSILVAFLVINKLSFTLELYYELQGYLSKMNQASIELTQLACAYTSGYQQEEFKNWRFEVVRQTLILLKATVLVIHKGGQDNVWEIPELKDDPLLLFLTDDVLPMSSRFKRGNTGYSRRSPMPKELYVWGFHLRSDKNLRVPIRMAQRLRDAIMQHKNLSCDPLDSVQEQNLLDSVKEFMDSYHGVRKYLTCPLPLPLVQLGRIFVIFYLFTLPFALLNLGYFQMVLLIVLMTYGFMGMEILFVELDDPFAEDPNDLPLTEEARATGEDIILSLMHADGKEAVNRMRKCFRFTERGEVKIHSFPTNEPNEMDPLV